METGNEGTLSDQELVELCKSNAYDVVIRGGPETTYIPKEEISLLNSLDVNCDDQGFPYDATTVIIEGVHILNCRTSLHTMDMAFRRSNKDGKWYLSRSQSVIKLNRPLATSE